MKLLQVLCLSLCAIVASAQQVAIGFPEDGASVTPGSNITVEVDRPNTLTGSTEVAVVIGFTSCAESPCQPSNSVLGMILYNGPYDPEYRPGAPASKPPHQNFSVMIPASAAAGSAQLNVGHVSLVGAGQTLFSETLNVTLNVAAPGT